MSSGRGSHWISTLRNRGRVRSSFEQGRRLLAANFADYSIVIPTQRLGARFCWATSCRWFCCCCRCYHCRVCQRCSSCPAVPPWCCAGAPAAAVVSAAAECSDSARVAVLTVASAVKATVAGLRALRRAIDRIPWLLGRVSRAERQFCQTRVKEIALCLPTRQGSLATWIAGLGIGAQWARGQPG